MGMANGEFVLVLVLEEMNLSWIWNKHGKERGADYQVHASRTPHAMTSNQFSLYHSKLYYDYVTTNYFINIIFTNTTTTQRFTHTHTHNHTHKTARANTPFQVCSPKRLLWITRSMTSSHIHIIHTPSKMFYVSRFTFYDHSNHDCSVSFPHAFTMSNDMQSWLMMMMNEEKRKTCFTVYRYIEEIPKPLNNTTWTDYDQSSGFPFPKKISFTDLHVISLWLVGSSCI